MFLVWASKIGLARFWQNTRLYIVTVTAGVSILSLFFSPGSLETRVIAGLFLSLRFILLVSFGVLFSMVTNPIEIPGGFLKARLPHKFGITLMVGYRMMPLISQKIFTIITAQKARGANISFSLKNIPKLPFYFSSLTVPILHSTLETSVRLSDTLISRGYDPNGRITVPPKKLSYNDIVFVTISLVFVLFSWIK